MVSRVFCLLLLVALALPAQAQQGLTLHVVDGDGIAIPFATVMADPGGLRVADDSGWVRYPQVATGARMALRVQRIGYEPQSFRAVVPDTVFRVVLTALPRTVAPVLVTERANTVLARTGFYERAQELQSGSFTGEFITPEDLERLGVSQVSRAVAGSRYVSVQRTTPYNQAVLLGRASCGMNILLNGVLVRGIIESDVAGATSLNAFSNAGGGRGMAIEDVITGSALAAVEIYPSVSNAPPAIKAAAVNGRQTCGVIAFWTGPRR